MFIGVRTLWPFSILPGAMRRVCPLDSGGGASAGPGRPRAFRPREAGPRLQVTREPSKPAASFPSVSPNSGREKKMQIREPETRFER